jgi:hypothetical protein
VAPEARGVSDLVITVFGEAFGQELVGEDPSLRESVHALFYANIDVVVVDKVLELILGYDFVGY